MIAYVLHSHHVIGLHFFVTPFRVVQNNIFTVGGFFFFTAGFMARKVYLSRYANDSKSTSIHLVKKGLMVLTLYFSYIFFVHLYTNTPFPDSLMQFIFNHRFFTKVLFTFGILFTVTPVIILLFNSYKKVSIFLLLLVLASLFAYDAQWNIPDQVNVIFFDRDLFLYPIFPALVIYASGFLLAHYEPYFLNKTSSNKASVCILFIFIIHLVSIKINANYEDFVLNKDAFTLIETITPYLAIILMRNISKNAKMIGYSSCAPLTYIGRSSLCFYLSSNFLLSIVTLHRDNNLFLKIIAFVGIGFLAYIITYWQTSMDAKYKFELHNGGSSRNAR